MSNNYRKKMAFFCFLYIFTVFFITFINQASSIWNSNHVSRLKQTLQLLTFTKK